MLIQMRILRYFIVLLLTVPRLANSQNYLPTPHLEKAVIIPVEINNIQGKFLDNPTFDYTGFKLSIAVGCENQLVTEREFRVATEKQRDDAQSKLNESQSNFKNAVENSRIKSEAQEIIITNLNNEIKTNQNKYLKARIRSVTITIVGILSVWGLTKAGIL